MSADARSATAAAGGGTIWSRPRRRPVIVAAAVALIAVAVVIGIVIGNAGSSPSSGPAGHAASAVDSHYGGYPSWLRNTKLPPTNAVVQASVAHPQVHVVEGNTMDVTMPSGEATITAVGPTFPAWVPAAAQSGHLNEGNPVPASFTVTVIAAHGTVPLRASAFSILTAEGQLVHPALTVAGGKPAPAVLKAGQHLNLTLKTSLTEGDGSVRWAPIGSRVLAGWLYQLELD
jgi:hypothetical protein